MGEGDEYESDNVHVHDMVYWFFFWHGYESTCTLQLKDPKKVRSMEILYGRKDRSRYTHLLQHLVDG